MKDVVVVLGIVVVGFGVLDIAGLLDGLSGQDFGRMEEKYVPQAPEQAVGQAVRTDSVEMVVGQPHGTGISER